MAGAVLRETTARGGNGCQLVVATERHTLSAAATSTTTIQVPARATLLDVSGIVQTAVTGPAASFTVGDGTDADKFGTGITIAAGSTFDGSDHTAVTGNNPATAAYNIVFTGTGANFTGGVIDVQIMYLLPDAMDAAMP